jgi:hypothetical protein
MFGRVFWPNRRRRRTRTPSAFLARDSIREALHLYDSLADVERLFKVLRTARRPMTRPVKDLSRRSL